MLASAPPNDACALRHDDDDDNDASNTLYIYTRARSSRRLVARRETQKQTLIIMAQPFIR
jgi:hypothetical protein